MSSTTGGTESAQQRRHDGLRHVGKDKALAGLVEHQGSRGHNWRIGVIVAQRQGDGGAVLAYQAHRHGNDEGVFDRLTGVSARRIDAAPT